MGFHAKRACFFVPLQVKPACCCFLFCVKGRVFRCVVPRNGRDYCLRFVRNGLVCHFVSCETGACLGPFARGRGAAAALAVGRFWLRFRWKSCARFSCVLSLGIPCMCNAMLLYILPLPVMLVLQ